MGLFDFLRRAKPARVKPRATEPEIKKAPEVATREAVDLLRPHLLPACFGAVHDEESDHLVATASKVGGKPYAEDGERWPIDEFSGREMVFVCQVDSSDVPISDVLPVGLTAIFADGEHMENCDLRATKGPLLLRHYSNPADSRQVPLKRSVSDASADETINRRLVFESGVSLPDDGTIFSLDFQRKYGALYEWARTMGLNESHDPFHDARRLLLGEQPAHPLIQIGGHPQWVQYAEPPDEGQLPHEEFVMQINTDSELGLFWYDEGSIYIYGDTKSFKFDYAIFQCC